MLSVEVRYKMQTHMSKEFTHAIDWLGQHMPKSCIKISLFLEPSVALDYCFFHLITMENFTQFVDWSQEELEPWNKNELISRCKRKRMAPKNEYFRFISWLPDVSRFYAITVTGVSLLSTKIQKLCHYCHNFWPDLTCVIDRDNDEEQHWIRKTKTYLFCGVSNCKTFVYVIPNKIWRFSSVWGQWPDLGSKIVQNPSNQVLFAFCHDDQHSRFCFAALAHVRAILSEMTKSSIVIGWKN